MAELTGHLDAIEEGLTMAGMARSLIDSQGGDEHDPTYSTDADTGITFLDEDGAEVDPEEVIEHFTGDSPASYWLDDALEIEVVESRDLYGSRRTIKYIDVLVAFGGPNIRVRFTEDGRPRIIGNWWMDHDERRVDDGLGVDDLLYSLADGMM